MNITSPLFSAIVGLLCGVISGFGIGGGSILMVWMTAVIGIEQKTAQGINLLYFLPTAIAALFFHIRKKCVCWRAVIPAVLFGCISAALFSFLATKIDVTLLREFFGGFLLVIGTMELMKKTEKDQK